MDAFSYTTFRQSLASILDQVNDTHEPVLITRQKGKPAILMSLEDFNSFQETAYLMANPKNAQRLSKAIYAIEKGKTIRKNITKD